MALAVIGGRSRRRQLEDHQQTATRTELGGGLQHVEADAAVGEGDQAGIVTSGSVRETALDLAGECGGSH